MRKQFSILSYRNLFFAALAVIVIQGAVIANLYDTGSEVEEKELTAYQQNYVDCPDEHLDACTELSRQITEEVYFQSYEDGRIYLETGDNRTIIADIDDRGNIEIVDMS